MFKGENSQQVNRRQTPPINQREENSQQVNRRQTPPINQREKNYFEWLRVWKTIVSERNPHNKDLFAFERAQKESFTQLIKRELEELKYIKVSLDMKVKFKKENDDENKIKGYFKEHFRKINNKIDQWVKGGSGWEVEKIELVYVNIARFQLLRGGTYLPLPEKLKIRK